MQLYATMCNILPWWNEDAWVLNDGFSEFPLCCWGPALFFQGESWAWNCMDLLIVGSAIFETLVQVPYRHGHPVIARSILELSPWASMSQWNTCLAPDHIDFDICRHLDAFEYVWILFSLESHFNSRAEGPTAKDAPPNTGVESLSNLRVIRIVRITRLVRLTRIARITRCLAPGRLPLLPLLCPQLPSNRAISELPWKKSREGSEQFLGILRGHRGARR